MALFFFFFQLVVIHDSLSSPTFIMFEPGFLPTSRHALIDVNLYNCDALLCLVTSSTYLFAFYIHSSCVLSSMPLVITPALTVAVIRQVLSISKTINGTVTQVKSNQIQCQRLNARIQNLVSFLSNIPSDTNTSKTLHQALIAFHSLLEECLLFIETFVHASKFKRFLKKTSYQRQFDDLHAQLNQLSADISFGISVERAPVSNYDKMRQPSQTTGLSTVDMHQIGFGFQGFTPNPMGFGFQDFTPNSMGFGFQDLIPNPMGFGFDRIHIDSDSDSDSDFKI